MAGKARPSLRKKTLENVMLSNLSVTDKECIKAVFEEADSIVRCKDCKHLYFKDMSAYCPFKVSACRPNGFCSYGERRADNAAD